MWRHLNYTVLALILCGCAAINHGKSYFVRVRDYDVGRSVDLSYDKPTKIVPHSPTQDKYIYELKNGCSWAYYVNKTTRVVESWEYISSPEKCELGADWFQPW